MEKKSEKNKGKTVLVGILAIEMLLVIVMLFLLAVPIFSEVYAVVGTPNVTVTTLLQVGNVLPEITSITVNGGSSINLIANSTVSVIVYLTLRDFNGEEDLRNASVIFWNMNTTTYAAADDNNRHYNSSCVLNVSYGTAYEANATCNFTIQYYSEAGTWNASALVYDNSSLSDRNNSLIIVNQLLAIGLPDTIDYGVVNSTEVSLEKIANITNFGNAPFNVSLQGYAMYLGDNMSMNCTLGIIKNISINYEKYNVTDSTPGSITLTQFESNYTNLTSTTVVVRRVGLGVPYRQNDAAPYTDDTNSSYWRMYVPTGVAGSCRGNIIFGAVQSGGLG